jgi:DNA-binding GntR family transcriptional regulator
MANDRTEELASQLRKEIVSGVYGHAGSGRIPTTAELAERWNVARNTVYYVIQYLRSEGYIREKGKYLTVNYPLLDLPGITPTFDKYLSDHGLKPIMENLIDPTIEELPPDLAQIFKQSSGLRVVHRMRLQSADDQPLRIAENWYPASLAGEFVEAMRANKDMDVLSAIKAKHGVFIETTEDEVITRFPTGEERKSLKIARTEPVFEIRRKSTSADGTAIMFNKLVLVGPQFRLTYRYHPDHWK